MKHIVYAILVASLNTTLAQSSDALENHSAERSNTLSSTTEKTIDSSVPESVTVPAFLAAGTTAQIDPGAGTEAATAKIGQLWQAFYKETMATIPNKITPPKVLGIYNEYESDYRGKYRLSAACEVVSLKDVPQGMYGIQVPSKKYLKFKAVGEQPASIMKAWAEIWKYFSDASHPQRAYTVDFENYKSPELVEIFIAVKE